MIEGTKSGPALRIGRVLMAACAIFPVIAPGAEEGHCDPLLKQPSDNPHGYRLRGDRCEGIYVRDVAGSTLSIVSLTENLGRFNPSAGGELRLEWTAPADSSIRIRAQSLRRHHYYRMDTVRPAKSNSYIWPLDLAAALKLGGPEIGMVGRLSSPKDDVYVPVRISGRARSHQPQVLEVVLLPVEELVEVYWSLARGPTDGSPATYIKKAERLRRGYYPAETPIMIALPPLKDPGMYDLEFSAELKREISAESKPAPVAVEQIRFYLSKE